MKRTLLANLRSRVKAFLYLRGLGTLLPEASGYRLFEAMLRLHDYRTAAAIVDVARRRHPDGADGRSMICSIDLRNGEIDSGLAGLEELIARRDLRAVKRLLFRTGVRPRDPAACAQVFGILAEDGRLPPALRCYALIALAYGVLKSGDHERAEVLVPALCREVEALRLDPATFACAEENRDNLTKLIISLHTCLYHLHLLRADVAACEPVWHSMLEVEARIDHPALHPDVRLRMISNLARCLCLGVLGFGDPRMSLLRSREALDRLRAEAVDAWDPPAPVRGRRPQENHRQVLRRLQQAAEELADPDPTRSLNACRDLARLLNHSSNPGLSNLLFETLQQGVRAREQAVGSEPR